MPHVDAGASPFAALAPTPVRASSLGGTLDADLAAVAGRSGNGKWPNLPRAIVANRLTELVRDPTKINQAGLNACGSATAMYLWAKRNLDLFARFAMDLYDNGSAQFGSVRVTSAGLGHKDPSKMSWGGNMPPLCDWMLLSAVLRTNGTLLSFGGEPDDAASGITLPGELEDWLKQGVRYSSVSNEANKFFNKDLDHLKKLNPTANEDVIVLINADVVKAQPRSAGVLGRAWDAVTGKVLEQFPNHWFVLEKPVEVVGGQIKATGWTWGASGNVFAGSADAWDDGYYGAIKAKV
jgi:hypothetical protein